ncbi:MAG: acetyltransferase [Actinomycetota bacterium]|nr:acetyltransferase [Actinomycetota bacterium]
MSAFDQLELFSRVTRLGTFSLEPVDADRDAEVLHGWVTHPKSVYWDMQEASVDDVRAEYARVVDDPHHDAWFGRVDGEPAFLAETYDPAHSELADHYDVLPGDVGMHVLVAPTDRPRPGFTAEAMRTVMVFCFADHRHDRVVVEPDVRNNAIAALNAAAGFAVDREIPLRHKTAALSASTRAQFHASRLGGGRR